MQIRSRIYPNQHYSDDNSSFGREGRDPSKRHGGGVVIVGILRAFRNALSLLLGLLGCGSRGRGTRLENTNRLENGVDLVDGKLVVGIDGAGDGGVDEAGGDVDGVAGGGDVERKLVGVSGLSSHRIADCLEV